mmetsp:Transcript_5042/g.14487  ORF Transcript_5042/g.14487 Transcript_5042/m.14487 type:complete len:150 (-) Transcript_5042:486-935(-)
MSRPAGELEADMAWRGCASSAAKDSLHHTTCERQPQDDPGENCPAPAALSAQDLMHAAHIHICKSPSVSKRGEMWLVTSTSSHHSPPVDDKDLQADMQKALGCVHDCAPIVAVEPQERVPLLLLLAHNQPCCLCQEKYIIQIGRPYEKE